MVAASSARLPHDEAAFEHVRGFDGAVLFVDARRSLEILDYVREHAGRAAASDLFMRFLANTAQVMTATSGARCLPRGDAVLATVDGPQSTWRALQAALAAMEYVTYRFEPEYRKRFSCDTSCENPGCTGAPTFEVRAGIAVDYIDEYRLSAADGEPSELQASAVSVAAKLTKRVRPPYSIAITRDAYDQLDPDQAARFDWSNRNVKLGNRYRAVLVMKSHQ